MAGESAVESVAVEAFGVTVAVTADPEHFAAVSDFLPPYARTVKRPPERGRFALVKDTDDGLLRVVCDEQSITSPSELRLALGILDAELRMYIALHAPDHVFVHAGVVGVEGRAIVLPGRSFAGKTTLVAALVKAGAEYWSDEYAVLDADGLVHPYPKPLSVRVNDTRETDEQPVESLGGRAGEGPIPVAVIAFTSYRPGSAWALRARTAGEGAVKLLEHSIAARSRPEQVLAAVRRAATDAVVLEGERGDAGLAASALLSQQAASLTEHVSSSHPPACCDVADTTRPGSAHGMSPTRAVVGITAPSAVVHARAFVRWMRHSVWIAPGAWPIIQIVRQR